MSRKILHRSSLIVAAIAVGVMVRIVVPGLVRDRAAVRFPSRYADNVQIDHGWPLVYLTRIPQSEGPFPAITRSPWLMDGKLHWTFWEADSQRFSAAALALDIAVALAIVTGAVAAWEGRRRHRGHIGQVRLAELLLLMAVAAGICGWLAHEHQAWRREQPHLHALSANYPPYAEGFGARFAPTLSSSAPRWLQLLAGGRRLPDFFQRCSIVHISYDSDQAYEGFADALAHLQQLEGLRVISIASQTQRKPIPFEDLGEIRQLRVLDLSQYATGAYKPPWQVLPEELEFLPPLERLILPGWGSLRPDAAAVMQKRMPQCEVISATDE